MSDIDPLAGCGFFCLLAILLYVFWFWIPVFLIAASAAALAHFRRPRQPYRGILWAIAIGLGLLLIAGLVGYITLS